MYTTSIENFKIQQKELHRQAAAYRLVRRLERPHRRAARIYGAVGQTLIASGEELMKFSRAAH